MSSNAKTGTAAALADTIVNDVFKGQIGAVIVVIVDEHGVRVVDGHPTTGVELDGGARCGAANTPTGGKMILEIVDRAMRTMRQIARDVSEEAGATLDESKLTKNGREIGES